MIVSENTGRGRESGFGQIYRFVHGPHRIIVFAQLDWGTEPDASDGHLALLCEGNPFRADIRVRIGIV